MASLILNINVDDKGTAKVKTFTDTVSATRGPMDAMKGRTASQSAEFTRAGNIATVMAGQIKSLIGAYAGFATVKDIFTRGMEMERIEKTLTAISGSGAAEELAFIHVEAERLGLKIPVMAQGFAQINAAMTGTTLEGQGARDIFIAISEAMAILGRSNDALMGSLIAIEQMVSKGQVMSQELKLQLGNQLPGAIKIASSALGVTTVEMMKMLEQGKVIADDFLPKFAKKLHELYGPATIGGVHTMTAEMNRLSNAWTDLSRTIQGSLIGETVVVGFKTIAAFIDWFDTGIRGINIGLKVMDTTIANVQDRTTSFIKNPMRLGPDYGLMERSKEREAEMLAYIDKMLGINQAGALPGSAPPGAAKKSTAVSDMAVARDVVEFYKQELSLTKELNGLRIKSGLLNDIDARNFEMDTERLGLLYEQLALKTELLGLDDKPDEQIKINRRIESSEKENEALVERMRILRIIDRQEREIAQSDFRTDRASAQGQRAGEYENALVSMNRMSPIEAMARDQERARENLRLEVQSLEIKRMSTGDIAKQRDLYNQILLLKDRIKDTTADQAQLESAINGRVRGVLDSAMTRRQMLGRDIDGFQRDINSGRLNAEQVGEYEKAITILKNQASGITDIANGMGDAFSNAFEDMIFGAKTFKESLADLGMELSRLIMKKMVLEPLANSIASGVSGIPWGGIAGGIGSGLMGMFGGGGGAIGPGIMTAAGGAAWGGGDGVSLMGAAAGAGAGAPQKPQVTVINVASESDIHRAMIGREGEEIVVNHWLNNYSADSQTRQAVRGR